MVRSHTHQDNMKFTIHPLTPDLWPALEDLFGKRGACNGCWCMYWLLGFKTVTRRESTRPIMRHDLRGIAD